MPAKCLVISDRQEDLELGKYLASTQRFDFNSVTEAADVRSWLLDHPQTIVLWNGDERASAEAIAQILEELISPIRVFVITDNPLNTYPHLFKFPAFCHHVYRRFKPPAPSILARLATAVLTPHPFGIENYFPGGAESQKITLKTSGQKLAAVEAIQKVLTRRNVMSRLSAMAAQASDELIMNAIFDAPVNPAGVTYRRALARDADFELADREHVEIQVVSTDDYVGISVSDQFGSLKKDVLLGFLRKDYQGQSYMIRGSDPGAGLGLNGTIQAGLSLLFVCKPKVRTEVMLFFPNTGSYREYREGFRFLSIISD